MPKRIDEQNDLHRSLQMVRRIHGRLWCKPGRLWLLTQDDDDPLLAGRGITQDAPPPHHAIALEPVIRVGILRSDAS
jgi:hypothetical protein